MINPDRFAPWVSEAAQIAFSAHFDAPPAPSVDIETMRAHYDQFNRRHLTTALDNYSVEIERQEMHGVMVDVVTPPAGIRNDRTLLCLHGGAFMWGRGAGALLEAVPVAATLGIRVIAVEYALAPEQRFPAAVDDVLTVYQALLRELPASKIGIYGCSAGGMLTAQTTARLIAEKMPLPGAITMLCGAGLDMLGDSSQTTGELTGKLDEQAPAGLAHLPYFSSCDVGDPLVFPGNHPEVMAEFPPSLLVSGTRDFAASSVSTMHRRLLAAGAHAELLIFDGMWHAFHMATTLPEAKETFSVMARFFDQHLG